MRFIIIETKWDGAIALSTNNINSIQLKDNIVYFYMGDDSPIATQFTDISHAVDYIQRAPSVSLNNSVTK